MLRLFEHKITHFNFKYITVSFFQLDLWKIDS